MLPVELANTTFITFVDPQTAMATARSLLTRSCAQYTVSGKRGPPWTTGIHKACQTFVLLRASLWVLSADRIWAVDGSSQGDYVGLKHKVLVGQVEDEVV